MSIQKQVKIFPSLIAVLPLFVPASAPFVTNGVFMQNWQALVYQSSPTLLPAVSFRTVIQLSMFVCISIITQIPPLPRISRIMEIRHKNIKFPQYGKCLLFRYFKQFFHRTVKFMVELKYLFYRKPPLTATCAIVFMPPAFLSSLK